MSCFASKKSGDPSSQGSAGTRHTCILFACHGEMQWSRTRRAQQGARLAARRRRPLFFCEMSVYIVEKIPCDADNSFEFIPWPCYIYPEQMLKIQENITNERYRMDKMLQQY